MDDCSHCRPHYENSVEYYILGKDVVIGAVYVVILRLQYSSSLTTQPAAYYELPDSAVAYLAASH